MSDDHATKLLRLLHEYFTEYADQVPELTCADLADDLVESMNLHVDRTLCADLANVGLLA